jgi:hypothetical protein
LFDHWWSLLIINTTSHWLSLCVQLCFIQLYFCKIHPINNQIIFFLGDRLYMLKELQICSLTIWVKAMTTDCWSTIFCGMLSYPIWKILSNILYISMFWVWLFYCIYHIDLALIRVYKTYSIVKCKHVHLFKHNMSCVRYCFLWWHSSCQEIAIIFVTEENGIKAYPSLY